MRHIIFESAETYPVALLIKHTAFHQRALDQHYMQPLQAEGLSRQDVICFRAEYAQKTKVSAAFIKECLAEILPTLVELKTQVIYVADTAYFKALTGQTKADPHHGYALPCKLKGYSHLQVVLGINYQALIYNPELAPKLAASLKTVQQVLAGTYQPPGANIIHQSHYPSSVADIAAALKQLHAYPQLSCDIETFSLRFYEAGIASIAFAWSPHEGLAFACDYLALPEHS